MPVISMAYIGRWSLVFLGGGLLTTVIVFHHAREQIAAPIIALFGAAIYYPPIFAVQLFMCYALMKVQKTGVLYLLAAYILMPFSIAGVLALQYPRSIGLLDTTLASTSIYFWLVVFHTKFLRS